MSDKSLAEKLQIKAGRSILLVDAPGDYRTRLGVLPDGVTLSTEPGETVDIVQVFVRSRAQLEEQLPLLKECLKPGGMLWVTYPKGTSRMKADIDRDSIYAYARTLGMEGVAMVAVDEEWSAFRLKIE